MYKNFNVVLLSFLVFLLACVAMQGTASALSGSEFQAGRIMDDGVFFNSNSIDTANIQTFLNSKVPVCDTNGTQPRGSTTRAAYGASVGNPAPYTCLKDYRQDTPSKVGEDGLCNAYSGGNKSAAQIINDVGKACGISPKVLIVLLEKEQSLVTDDWPWSIQYRSATGYGCPDTAPCDSEYYGFFNQVYSAARQFKRYQRDPTSFGYRAGRNNYIQYNPNADCGGTNVYIQNQTTAGLYNYTPYQPNVSALANLNGAGDSCAAYGNRNFWVLYNNWFGGPFGPTKLIDAPASISWGTGRIDVFGQGADGGLWQKWYDVNAGGWQPWNKLPGTLGSAPAVASWGTGRLDIFSATASGELQHLWYGGGSWGSWESLGKPAPNVTLASAPGAISWGTGRIDIFARGSDGELWQKWYDVNAGGWQPWGRIGGVLNSAPTIASWAPGRLDLFSTGPAGDLQHHWFDGDRGGWQRWESLGKPAGNLTLSSGPGSVSWDTGRLDVFARGSDGVLWQKWFDGDHGGWQRWERFTGVINSAPTISSWEPRRLDEFSTGPAGDLQHFWFGRNGWGSWESLGYPRD